jgi:hypothetical protein
MTTSFNPRTLAIVLLGVTVVALLATALAHRRAPRVAEAPRTPAPVVQQGAPRVVAAEKPAADWLDAHPLDQLLRLARCIERSRGDSVGRAYPRSLEAVERLSCAAASGYDDHHFVYYTPPRGRSDPWRARGFTLEVEAVWDSSDEPVKRNIPATRSYLIDVGGRIHVTSERRRATPADSTLPMCELGGYASGIDCQPFVPRQRWGVRPQLPGAFITASRDTVRKGRPLEVTLDFDPLSPIDRLVSYSIAWSEGARPSTRRLTERQGWPGRRMTAVGFRETHVYADTGQKVIEVVFRTVGGERYVSRDTVVVRPR